MMAPSKSSKHPHGVLFTLVNKVRSGSRISNSHLMASTLQLVVMTTSFRCTPCLTVRRLVKLSVRALLTSLILIGVSIRRISELLMDLTSCCTTHVKVSSWLLELLNSEMSHGPQTHVSSAGLCKESSNQAKMVVISTTVTVLIGLLLTTNSFWLLLTTLVVWISSSTLHALISLHMLQVMVIAHMLRRCASVQRITTFTQLVVMILPSCSGRLWSPSEPLPWDQKQDKNYKQTFYIL